MSCQGRLIGAWDVPWCGCRTLGSRHTTDAYERVTATQTSPGTTTTYTFDSLNSLAHRNSANFGYDDLSNNAVLSPAPAGQNTTLLRDPAGARTVHHHRHRCRIPPPWVSPDAHRRRFRTATDHEGASA
jgi:hypothetical protein